MPYAKTTMDEGRVIVASRLLITVGVFCLIAGLYFLLIRPLFIMQPEDVRVAKITAAQLKTNFPDLFRWLGFVVRAWGLFVTSSGIFIMVLAKIPFRRLERWAWLTLAATGIPTLLIFIWIQILMKGEGRFILIPMLILYLLGLFLPFRAFFPKRPF